MVKVTKETAQKHRTDLVRATGQVMRAHGIAAASVAAIADRVGLTHGAIYRQFPSKDAMAAAAIAADFDTILGLLAQIRAQGGGLADYFRAYLATDHRDHFDWGCPAAPLAAEVGRTAPVVQSAFATGLQRNLDAIAALSGIAEAGTAQAYAIFALSSLAGAMSLARATRACDPDLSHQILQATLHTLVSDPRLPGRPHP